MAGCAVATPMLMVTTPLTSDFSCAMPRDLTDFSSAFAFLSAPSNGVSGRIHKLLSAITCHYVVRTGKSGLQSGRNGLQTYIACLMPVLVVIIFEEIDIGQD